MPNQPQVCDFCNSQPTRMYANPEIQSALLQTVWAKGHCAACDRCGDLLEARKLSELVNVVLKPGLPPFVREEFVRMYGFISPVRQPLLTLDEWKRRHTD